MILDCALPMILVIGDRVEREERVRLFHSTENTVKKKSVLWEDLRFHSLPKKRNTKPLQGSIEIFFRRGFQSSEKSVPQQSAGWKGSMKWRLVHSGLPGWVINKLNYLSRQIEIGSVHVTRWLKVDPLGSLFSEHPGTDAALEWGRDSSSPRDWGEISRFCVQEVG